MITFTTLAESKCDLLSSRHTTPAPGSSTSTATNETRSRRAASTARLILPASAGCDDDAQIPVEAAAVLDAAPAGPAANSSDGKARMTAVRALLGFTRILYGLPRHGCRRAVNPMVAAPGQAVQWSPQMTSWSRYGAENYENVGDQGTG
jgi:hypothetical protein